MNNLISKSMTVAVLLICILGFTSAISQTSFNISNQTTGDTLFTIDNNGQVGIGTTTPGASIDVNSSAVETASSFQLSNLDNTRFFRIYSGNATYSPMIRWHEGDALRFAAWTDTYNEFMRLTAEGNLGIGTTDPTAKLTISGSSASLNHGESAVYLQNSNRYFDFNGGMIFRGSGMNWNSRFTATDNLGADEEVVGIYKHEATAGDVLNDVTEVIAIFKNNGNVGIGTTSPDEKLTFAYDNFIGWEYSASNSSVAHKIGKSANGAGPLEFITTFNPGATGQTFSFKNPVDRMTILYNGNVGIGTTTPTEMLEVAGTIHSTTGGFRFPDGTTQTTAATGGGAGNTLDEAYDQGGSGAGRTITADNGAVHIDGTDGLGVSATNNSGTSMTVGILSDVDGSASGAKYGVYSTVGGEGNVTGVQGHAEGTTGSIAYGVIGSAGGASENWGGYFDPRVYISQQLSIGTESPSPFAALHVEGPVGEGIVFSGNLGTGPIPIEGDGTRMMWYPGQAAFRAGTALAGRWDDGNIGQHSFATGYNTEASGIFSTAMGHNAIAEGDYSTAWGYQIEVLGDYSFGISLGSGNTTPISQENTLAIMDGRVGIGEIAPTADLHVEGSAGVLFSAEDPGPTGTIPAEGSGIRMMWYPAKAAFRVGGAGIDNWNDINIGEYSFAMGGNTIASGTLSAAFGYGAIASGDYTFATGRNTEASGNYTTAMGLYVNTSGDGSFAIGDNSTTTASSFSTANQFNARFANGYNLYTNAAATIGVSLAASGNSWSSISDSTKKENFKAVNGEDFLNKISHFNLTSWNYKGQDPAQYRHYGPMAQDFYAAFGNDGIGTIGNDTTLASADFDGVNLIAIQALEKRTTKLQSENKQLKEEISTLKSKIERLETLFSKVEELTKTNNNQYAKNADNSK